MNENLRNFGRKKAEEVVFRDIDDWKHTFDAVPDLIAILDTEFRIVRANNSMAASLGMTSKKCIRLTCYPVIRGTDEPPLFCQQRQLLSDGLEHTVEICDEYFGGYFISERLATS